ncbi:MAG: hypothetical protein K8I82_04225 [Anaerolineae bacterium]|nr:hypothetical protein [Anaerolineae bacterium]
MIPQDRNINERWQVRIVLTLILAALLFFTQLENSAITIALVVGYVITLVGFDLWLRNSPDLE